MIKTTMTVVTQPMHQTDRVEATAMPEVTARQTEYQHIARAKCQETKLLPEVEMSVSQKQENRARTTVSEALVARQVRRREWRWM